MNIKDNYELHIIEKYYLINLIVGVLNKKLTKNDLKIIASSIKSKGNKSINDIIQSISIHYKTDCKNAVQSVMPSIEYFFNEVDLNIRRRCFNINTLPD